MRNEQRRFITDVLSKVADGTAALCAGLGLFFCWFWCVMQNPNSAVHFSRAGFSQTVYWVVVLAAAALAFLGVLAVARLMPTRLRLRFEGTASAVAIIVYAAVLFIPRLIGVQAPGVLLVQTAVSGMLAAWMFSIWGSIAGSLGPRRSIKMLVAALAISFVSAVGIYSLPSGAAEIFLSLLPLASMGLMRVCRTSAWGLDESAQKGHVEASNPPDSSWIRGPWPLRFYLTLLVQGMTLGLLLMLYSTVVLEKCTSPLCPLRFLNSLLPMVSVADFYGVMGILGVVLAAAIVGLGVQVLRLNFRKLIFTVGFPLMALGFLLLSSDAGFRVADASSHASGVNFTGGEVVCIAGYYYVVVTTWALCSYLVQTKGGDRIAVFSRSGLVLLSGQLVGFLACMAVGFGRLSRADFCTGAIFLLMLASLLIATDDRLWGEWGGIRPSDENRPSAFRSACSAVAKRYRLTEREQDILLLLARGRNMAFIAENLFITKDTVKTHCRNLYRKLGVHSQQELIDQIEAEIGVEKDQRFNLSD